MLFFEFSPPSEHESEEDIITVDDIQRSTYRLALIP